YRMVLDIRNLELSFGTEENKMEDASKEAREKLERSIATIKPLSEGHILTENDIHLLSPGDGFQWSQRAEVIGKRLRSKMPKDEIIYLENLQ
ncbi:MAG: SAF domain-containing protein, partial [Marinirhabdus sp.]|nr:SAF domain-containing protein [Marinirhabdus sp.]